MSEQSIENNLKWYVIHTYSGYENKVKAELEKKIKNLNLESVIPIVYVPVEEVVEQTLSGKKKVTQRKKYPCYAFVKMVMNDDNWYVVRNTRGVTAFVGPGSKPVALNEAEVRAMGLESATDVQTDIDVAVGDTVLITEGTFKDSTAVVKEVNVQKRTVKVVISMFGRDTPMEIGFSQVKHLD